ncbi:unnamed protein product [Oppiella nova]|uniref:Mitotic spindle assembly checkpoint protein MAD1 n=1 Tax=Oppiella nova TaxID=334625 RepID=A0A7R9Q8Z3_9ACAR|nr:unnamed protein product [Oppiella nova]CAG2158790.1 unnamed protein product [Oppiella nova]
MQSNQDFRSRLPLPKSVFKSAIARPSLQTSTAPSGVPPLRTSSSASQSCVKPTLKVLSTNSVQTALRLRPHPYLSSHVRPTFSSRHAMTVKSIGLVPAVSPQVVTRLDFDVENNRESLLSSPQDMNRCLTDKRLSSKTSPAVDWNSLSKEAEVIALKTQITKLETLLDEMKLKNSQICIDYDLKIEKLTTESERHQNKCLDFEKQMKAFELKSEESSDQLLNAREEFGREYEKYEKRINELTKTVMDLTNQLSDNEVAIDSVEATHQSQMVAVEHQMKALESKVIELSEEKEFFVKHIQQLESDAKDREQLDAELKSAKVNICLLNEELKSYKDGVKLSDILENELQELRQLREQNVELIRSNQLLTDVHSKNLVLEEKLIALETQLNERNNRLKGVMETDLEVNELRKRLSEWQELLANDSPIDVHKHLSNVQNNEIILRSELASLKTQFDDMMSKREQLESDLMTTRNELLEQNESIKKLNRKCLLFTKEKESYKSLINSYEHDVTLDWNKVSKDRISSLEALVDDYRNFVEQLETEIKVLKNGEESEECQHRIKELENSFNKIKEMKEHQISPESEPMDTNCAPPREPTAAVSYRIIHFNQNPIAVNIAKHNEDFKRLVEENQRLQNRVLVLETGSDADVTQKCDEGIKNSQELEKLQKKLVSAEKSQQKIIDAFKRTSKEFREVCYRLTGFRIDLLKQNTYRLAHMYADSPDDVLMFESDGTDRTIKMLENQYSNKLQESVQTYLTAHDSFPAFLASLTLELFHKQTIV